MLRDTPIEALRQRYRPAQVRILFVGESPPAAGSFFYRADSVLFEATRDGFQRAYGSMPDGEAFLERFSAAGCWLWDLSLEPVNRFPEPERSAAAFDSEPALAQLLAGLAPENVVVVLKRIEPNVRRAMEKVASTARLTVVPFPRKNAGRISEAYATYIGELERLLRSARLDT